MKAAWLVDYGKPLEIRDTPVPQVGEEDVLVRIKASGINGGDVHLWRGQLRTPLPLIMGHEPFGVVEEVGRVVKGLKKGDHVALSPMVVCGKCGNCLAGNENYCENMAISGFIDIGNADKEKRRRYQHGWAEYYLIPAANALLVPSDLDFALVSRLSVLGVAGHALKRASLQPGETIAISPAAGGTGAAAVLLALHQGVGLVFAVGRDPGRLEQVRKLDPDRVVPLLWEDGKKLRDEIYRYTGGKGLD